MSASDPSLHSLGQPLTAGEIQFVLRKAALPGEACGIEAVYRPYRERDVKKTRHFGFLSGWIGGGDGKFLRVQREEFHSERQQFTPTGEDVIFSVPLRATDRAHAAYQLESVRLVARLTGTLEFERWFSTPPELDPAFGLKVDAGSLRGNLRPSGLAAQPLRGALPLWPSLRRMDLEFTPVEVPTLRLFEATAKHHWDGWRQTTPEPWSGGQTVVLRHIGEPTVWRHHEYNAFPRPNEPTGVTPKPPAGILPGVQLEIYWPVGQSIVLPEARFDGEPRRIIVPLSKLTPRMRELLQLAVRLRPGWEAASLSAAEWRELDAVAPPSGLPVSILWESSARGEGRLKIGRRSAFSEPYVCIFGAPYDLGRRYVLASLVVSPEGWTGPLPE